MENLINSTQLQESITASKVVNKKDCGIRYFFNEVLQLSTENNATLNLYNAIQEALSTLNKSRMNGDIISLVNFKETALKKIDPKFYGTAIEYQFACDSVSQLLGRYYNWYVVQHLEILDVDCTLTIPFKDEHGIVKKLTTKVDVIYEQQKEIHAVVYKNSKPFLTFKRIPKDPEKAGENCIIRDIRLALVHLGVQDIYPDKKINVAYHHLKNKEDRFETFVPAFNNGVDVGDNIVFCAHTDESIALAKSDIQKQIDDIYDGNFESKKNSFNCQQSCGFCTICPEFAVQKEEVKPPTDLQPEENESHSTSKVSYNKTQLEVVDAKPQPIRVVAGPGVGKSAVVIGRIKNLVENYGALPNKILVVTFTNQAVAELKKRLENIDGIINGDFAVYTYNGFGNEVVKEEYAALGFEEVPILASKMQKMDIIYNLLDTLAIVGLDYSDINQVLSDIYNFTVVAKKRSWIGKDIKEVQEDMVKYFNSTVDSVPLYQQLLEATILIQKEMKKNNWIDFEDQIFLINKLFAEKPEVLKKWQSKYSHILVDEFQDSDNAQCQLVASLATVHRSITIVGDEDQGIYGWRGASVSNIIEFDKFFPELLTITLNENYRSVKEVVDTANALIKHNAERMGKIIIPTIESKGLSQVVCASDFEAEKKFIAEKIVELTKQGYKYSDFAILTRSNSSKENIEEYLKFKSIPVYSVGKKSLFQQENIAKAINILKLLNDLSNDIVAISVLQYYDITLAEIADMIAKKPEGLGIMEYITFAEVSQGLMRTLQPECIEKLGRFLDDFNSLSIHSKEDNSALLFLSVLDLCGQNEDTEKFTEIIADFIGENEVTYDKIIEFLSLAHFFQDDTESAVVPDSYNAVSVITAHSVKGLEFPVVFIAKSNDYCANLKTVQQTEEARRLFFVSVSRAKRNLYTLWHDNRDKSKKIKKPKFIEEIEEVCEQARV